ncbi:hypothetical protein EB796_025139 [Bugula neritina]|uniref:Uncharacterized protein n=1 Tax=Bugula neritina TaxID=10212 RepID=A0A7J7ISP1_BUGNE|nr:hypothetical protein EB796_025139 [Bugula neritina]
MLEQLYVMFLQFRARDVLNEAVSNCVAEDPVKRMVQSVHYVRLFAPNCPTIELPLDGCGLLPKCLQKLFEPSGQRILCHRKKTADKCFKKAMKGCSYAAGVRDLFINQALPTVCKRNQYFNYKETVIPSSCPAPQY